MSSPEAALVSYITIRFRFCNRTAKGERKNMYQINIRKEFWNDSRFIHLCAIHGKFLASGIMVQAWLLAQAFWVQSGVEKKGLIPDEVWDAEPMFANIEKVGLAQRVAGGIYLAGSKKSFGWIEAAISNGKKKKIYRKSGGCSEIKSEIPFTHGDLSEEARSRDLGNPELITSSSSINVLNNKVDAVRNINRYDALFLQPRIDLVKLWNENRGALAAAASGGGRSLKVQEFLGIRPDLTPEQFADAVKKMASSSFLLNRTRKPGERKVKFDLSWLLKDDNLEKVIEGKYDNETTKIEMTESLKKILEEEGLPVGK